MSKLKSISLPKAIMTAAITVIVSTSAMAHSPQMHTQENAMDCEKMKAHMTMMQKMDHSAMDMSSPAMQSLMKKMNRMKQMYHEHCTLIDTDS